jgi:hypothetical protein
MAVLVTRHGADVVSGGDPPAVSLHTPDDEHDPEVRKLVVGQSDG